MERPILTLYLPTVAFEELHTRLSKTRSTSKTVTVDKQALVYAMMDYSEMLAALRKAGKVETIDDEDQRHPHYTGVMRR